jgi:hypothetical protein
VGVLGDLGSTLLGAAYTYRLLVAAAAILGVVIVATVARRRGWLGRVRRHPVRAIAILIPTIALALPVGWYLASPLVLSTTIDEPAPIIAATTLPAIGAAASAPALTSAAPEPAASARPAPPLPLALAGDFHGSDDFHFGRGTARLIETAPGSYVVRLEHFAVRNGPDLYVYLSSSAEGYAAEAIELGRLKADTGNQNYAVPTGSLRDPAAAASVVIWCKQFSHLFATAPLAAG